MIENIFNQFNNREYALFFIFTFVILLLLFKKDTRKSIKGLFSKFLFQILFVIISYNFLITYFLYLNGFWNISLFKESLYWFFGSSLILAFNIKNIDRGKDNIMKEFFSLIGLTAFIGLILNVFTFSFFIELLLQIFLIFIIIIISYTEVYLEKKSEYLKILNFTKFLLSVIISIFVILSLINLYEQPNKVFNIKNIYSLLYPIIYLIFYYPFLYVLRLLMIYESLFMRINIKDSFKYFDLLYVKYKIFTFCGLNIFKLNKFSTGRGFYMENKEEINNIIYKFKILDKFYG